MALHQDVPICVENRTHAPTTKIALFTERYLLRHPANGGDRSDDVNEKEFTAWMILNVPSEVSFAYPLSSSVRSSWYEDKTSYHSGPFDAPIGSTWSLVQNDESDCPVLEIGTVVIIILLLYTHT